MIVAFVSPVNDFVTLTIAAFSILDVRRREKLASLIGKYEFGYSKKELEEMRNGG
jgi:hypothetical protein